jgi:hypothetical protein
MSDLIQAEQPTTTSDFVKTHCQICAAGQTITRADPAGSATYCLLLREWMTARDGKPLIVDCDRFEQREDLPLLSASAAPEPPPSIDKPPIGATIAAKSFADMPPDHRARTWGQALAELAAAVFRRK